MSKQASVISWSLVIAIGGFLFGFDTAVISGAEQAIQQFWHLSTFQHGLTVSIALVGTIIGALTGAYPSDRWGRKRTLYLIALCFLLASVGTALAGNWYLFLLFRLLGGWGVGASSVTAPIYISEISPAARRGRLVALFQFNIVLGILISYLSNYLIGSLGWSNSWRVMLGIQAIPSLIFLLLIRILPESPRWLILERHDESRAMPILESIYREHAAQVLRDIYEHKNRMADRLQASRIFQKEFRTPVLLAMAMAVFNQWSGINAIIYYAPRVFEMTGLGAKASLLSTAGVGLVNFIFTLLAMNFIDRFGRRRLMYIGSFGLIATLATVSWAFFTSHFADGLVVISLFVYIAFFAFSQGAVIWVFISEIFPNQVRAKGQTVGSFTHWTMAAVITFIFPALTQWAGGGITFGFFGFMMVLQLVFVWKFMPETKGKTLEAIQDRVIAH